jgi:nucleoside-diphosphate-sugar epimerase
MIETLTRSYSPRLCGSLQVDIEKLRQLLEWRPPLTLDQGSKKAAKGYGHEAGI